jgi:hypothetical protein
MSKTKGKHLMNGVKGIGNDVAESKWWVELRKLCSQLTEHVKQLLSWLLI